MAVIKKVIVHILFFVILILLSSYVYAQTESFNATLNQYISELQKNPNDNALREKIIKHVQTMRTMPTAPMEVVKHEGAAEYAFKSAKNESDYLDSAKEYEKALLIAPWLATDYFNCGVAYEKAGQFKNAITQFNFYLMAAPEAQDVNAVRKRIGGLEYAAGKSAQESSSAVIATKKQNEYDGWLKKIDGTIFYHEFKGDISCYEIHGRDVRAGRMISGMCKSGNPDGRPYTLVDHQFTFECFDRNWSDSTICIGTISDDGSRITMRGGLLEGWIYTQLR